MAEIALARVTKRFRTVTAVDAMDLTIADGEFFVLLGPTGAGKTTTLRLVAGLEQAGRGHGSPSPATTSPRSTPAARDVAFVFQQFSLYPHLSVYDNLAFPLRSPARRVPEAEIKQRVEEIAAMLRIAGKLQNRATQLSGGEMQRVAIGRALVRRPSIYLMDEPLSSLDAKLRADLRLELKRIQAELGATILYVTHDQTEAMTMANRIGVIEKGRLIQVGTPREIYTDPRSVYVATRLGQPAINLIPAGLVPNGTLPAGRKDCRRTHRAFPDRQGHERLARSARSTGSSISATRTTSMSASAATSIVTLVDPEAGLDRRRRRIAGAGRSPLFRRRRQPDSERIASCRPDTVTIDAALTRELIETVARRIIAHADELTALDQAIGDGDHGLNMKRGFEAVLVDLDAHAAKPLPEALKSVGMALVMKVGGASGPLYGTLFMSSARRFPPSRGATTWSPPSQPRSRRSRRAASPRSARRPCSTCWCPRRRRSPRGATRPLPPRGGRGDDPDEGAPRPRLVPRRPLDRPYGPGRAFQRIDHRGNQRSPGARMMKATAMSASSSSRIPPTSRGAPPTWCARWWGTRSPSPGAAAIPTAASAPMSNRS